MWKKPQWLPLEFIRKLQVIVAHTFLYIGEHTKKNILTHPGWKQQTRLVDSFQTFPNTSLKGMDGIFSTWLNDSWHLKLKTLDNGDPKPQKNPTSHPPTPKLRTWTNCKTSIFFSSNKKEQKVRKPQFSPSHHPSKYSGASSLWPSAPRQCRAVYHPATDRSRIVHRARSRYLHHAFGHPQSRPHISVATVLLCFLGIFRRGFLHWFLSHPQNQNVKKTQ